VEVTPPGLPLKRGGEKMMSPLAKGGVIGSDNSYSEY